jgi:hypothetical protein
VLEVLPASKCTGIFRACFFFRAVDDSAIFTSGPVEAARETFVASASWLFWNPMANPLLGEEGFTSPPRPNDGPSIYSTLHTSGGVCELYLLRSFFKLSFAVQTTTPLGLGTSEGGF